MVREINEFKLSSHPWRISWLGALHYPPPGDDEVRIAVHLSELKDDFDDPMSNDSLAVQERHEAILIKIGLIPLLKIGSVWIDGRRDDSRSARKDSLELELKHSQLHLIRLDEEIRINDEPYQILGRDWYTVGVKAASDIRASWAAIAYNPLLYIPIVVIPSSVLFQRCFVTSSNAVRRLAWGKLEKIIDLKSCGPVEGEPGTFYVDLFKDIHDKEGPTLANLVADAVAEDEYTQFHNALVSQSVNDDLGTRSRARGGQIKLSLPFSNPAKVLVLGRWLRLTRKGKISKKWGFLVTEIRHLEVKFAFDRLAIDRKNKGLQGVNRDDDDLEPGWIHPTKDSLPLDSFLPIESSGEPSNELPEFVLEEAGGISDPSLIIIERETVLQKYRNARLLPIRGAKSSGTATTGDARTNDDGLIPLDVVTAQSPKSLRTLADFFQVLEQLAREQYKIEILKISEHCTHSGRSSDHVISYLPRSIKGLRSWHLMVEGEGKKTRFRPRGYVVAQVIHAGRVSYLIELERKNNEAFSTACLQNQTCTPIGLDELAGFLIRVAKENGWGAADAYSHWKFVGINHLPQNQITHQARAIIQRLTR